MLCDDCKERPASVHITKINNSKKTEKHLCDTCAQKSGELTFSTDAQHTVQDFLKGMFSHGISGIPAQRSENACPHCGMSYNDFSRGGKIGCSKCFATFGERLRPLLRRIHGTNSHTGKVPKRGGGKRTVQRKLHQLRQELERYIGLEEYEQAARVRDEIRLLEKEITQ